MKKLIAILMTVALLCSLSVSAMAATTTEMAELVWEDFAETAEAVDADAGFYQIADWDLYMWIPSIFAEQELTEEDIEYGYISYLTPEDESAAVAIIVDDDQGMSLEEWEQALNDAGYETEIGAINGIKALVYEDPEADTLHVLYILLDSDQTMEFIFWPMSDEGFAGVASIMIASLQSEE